MLKQGRLEGKVALVTGGAQGVGRAACALFAAEGAAVAVLDIAKEAGEDTAALIRATGGQAQFFACDVSSSAQVAAAVAAAQQALGPITALFNHAGSIIVKPFLDTTEADWDHLMAVNVKSMYLVTRAVLPGMLAAGGGAIVCTSSISAELGTPMEVLYDTTKGACHMFARAIAVEFRDRNIRCNAVCPGFIKTQHGMREIEGLTRLGVDVSEAAINARQGRLCRPEEVAAAAAFLLSDAASFVNGTRFFVDNAFSAM